jgi:hypothetical protein
MQWWRCLSICISIGLIPFLRFKAKQKLFLVLGMLVPCQHFFFYLIMENFVQAKKEEDLDEDIVESDVELDNTDVVQPDNDPPQTVRDFQ